MPAQPFAADAFRVGLNQTVICAAAPPYGRAGRVSQASASEVIMK